MASAIQSVEGAKLLTAPKPGSGSRAESIAVVELGGKATLSAVTAAVENAKTPHREHSPPGVDAVVAGKLKPSATPGAIMAALKKADLMEE